MQTYWPSSAIALRATFLTNNTTLRKALAAGAAVVYVRDASGYSGGDSIVLDVGKSTEETFTVFSVSGTEIAVTTSAVYDHAVNATVGELTDPTTVTLKVKDSTGTTTTYTYALGTVTKDSTGKYSKNIMPTTSGAWFYWWAGTGAVIGTAQSGFQVGESEF